MPLPLLIFVRFCGRLDHSPTLFDGKDCAMVANIHANGSYLGDTGLLIRDLMLSGF